MVERPGDHLTGADDALVSVCPLLELISDRARFSGEPDTPEIAYVLHAHTSTGRPLGPDSFVEDPEQRLRRALKRDKPGRSQRDETLTPVTSLSCSNGIR